MTSTLLAPIGSAGAAWHQAVPVSPVTLTARQLRIITFIGKYQELWGQTPSYREIAREVGMGVSSVGYQIQRLVRLGVLRKPAKLPRVIVIQQVPVLPT